MSARKIAILGGAYDPITKGHIDIAQYVLKNSDIEEVWLSPCGGHLQKGIKASGPNRLKMCNLAIANTHRIYVCEYEVEHLLDGSAYTFIKSLKELWNNEIDFHYIIGMDNVHNFNTWRKSEELKSIVKFIIVPRKGVEICQDSWYRKEPHRFLNIGNGVLKSSSTEVRRLLKKWWKDPDSVQEGLDKLVDSNVLTYIATEGIYTG